MKRARKGPAPGLARHSEPYISRTAGPQMQTTDPQRGHPPRPIVETAPTGVEGPIRKRRERFLALASFLGDDSPVVREEIRRQYESAGRAGLPSLRRAARVDSPIVRSRARTLLLEREKTLALKRLLRHVSGGQIDLEKALFLLACYAEPRLDPRPWQTRLDVLAREVVLRTQGIENRLDRAQAMVEYLSKKAGFGSAKGDFHHPDNVHIHRVIERKRGMPLTLCALYMFIGRRAGISTACVPLPGLVMLRLHGDGESRIVDPYNRSQIRTDKDCREYLKQNGLPVKGAWFRDADDLLLLKRQISNLVRSAELRGIPREKRELSLVGRALDLHLRTAAPRTV
ncbi:MAG: transglutaminase family protein [Planctomycetes bacterium]|nr:transglutaminase family protein [Planctomycetota bacterium]